MCHVGSLRKLLLTINIVFQNARVSILLFSLSADMHPILVVSYRTTSQVGILSWILGV